MKDLFYIFLPIISMTIIFLIGACIALKLEEKHPFLEIIVWIITYICSVFAFSYTINLGIEEHRKELQKDHDRYQFEIVDKYAGSVFGCETHYVKYMKYDKKTGKYTGPHQEKISHSEWQGVGVGDVYYNDTDIFPIY